MKHYYDRNGDDWLDNLDTIAAGDSLPPPEDEELLQVATRLASALAPLREKARSSATNRHPAYYGMPFGQGQIKHQTRRHLSPTRLLVSGMLLLVCLMGIFSTLGVTTLWHSVHQALQVSTSLDQIAGIPIASLSPPHAGLKPLPLLPRVLPANTQASTYGVLTDASNPNIMTTFVADYHINGQDVQLFEQPSDVAFLSTTAQTVQIGARQGQLFQDDMGNRALQWYQNYMLCQLTSKLPVGLLIRLASAFQPIKSWDLIR